MARELPSDVDYRRLMADGTALSGTLAMSRFTRVGPPLKLVGAAHATLALERREDGATIARGEFSAPMEAQCQRCLEWMALTVAGTFALVLRDPSAAWQAPQQDAEEDDYVEVPDGRLGVLELIEDELLLACPMVPLHERGACADRAARDAARDERHRPFAGLSALLGADELPKD
jgi:uncharacterized protein